MAELAMQRPAKASHLGSSPSLDTKFTMETELRIYRDDVLMVAAKIAGGMASDMRPAVVKQYNADIADAAEAIVKEIYSRFSEAGVKDV